MWFGNLSDQACKAYNDACRHAAYMAFMEKGTCYWVYRRGEEFFVRKHGIEQPEGSEKVCVAQFWSSTKTASGNFLHTVQLRFDGAWSEWVHF